MPLATHLKYLTFANRLPTAELENGTFKLLVRLNAALSAEIVAGFP